MISTSAAGVYAILVGLSIFAWWAMVLSRNQGRMENRRIGNLSHLLAEFLAALTLILGGAGVLAGAQWAVLALSIGLGALLYSVVNVAGVFAERGNRSMVAVLVIEAVATLIFIVVLFLP